MTARAQITAAVARARGYRPLFHAGATLLHSRLTGRAIPWYVNLVVTSRCNLSCPYCFVYYGERHDQEPALDEIMHRIDELHALGTRYISLQGGEPLMRRDLIQIVDHALDRGMLVGLNTNGTLIDRNLPVLRKVHRTTISLEGSEHDHDRDRGAGSYRKITRNLRLARDAGIRNLSFQTTISTSTADSWEHVVDLAEEIGASVLLTEISARVGEELPEAGIPADRCLEIWERIAALKRSGHPIENTWEAISTNLRLGALIGPYEFHRALENLPANLQRFAREHRCPYGTYSAFMDSDGVFYPCPSLFGVQGYDSVRYGIAGAYRRMREDDRCVLCRSLINCQVNYLFSSLSWKTMVQLSRHALRRYSY